MDCSNCICLVEDEDKKWICDELQKECSQIKECPEDSKENE